MHAAHSALQHPAASGTVQAVGATQGGERGEQHDVAGKREPGEAAGADIVAFPCLVCLHTHGRVACLLRAHTVVLS